MVNKQSKAKKGPLKPNAFSDGQWIEKAETLRFSKAYFNATLYYLKCDSSDNDANDDAGMLAD